MILNNLCLLFDIDLGNELALKQMGNHFSSYILCIFTYVPNTRARVNDLR